MTIEMNDPFVIAGKEIAAGRTPEDDGNTKPTPTDRTWAFSVGIILGMAKIDSPSVQLCWYRLIGIVFYSQGPEEARKWLETARKRCAGI